MVQFMPEWFSEWVITDPDNWHLKDGAPEDVKKEFEKYMKEDVENGS